MLSKLSIDQEPLGVISDNSWFLGTQKKKKSCLGEKIDSSLKKVPMDPGGPPAASAPVVRRAPFGRVNPRVVRPTPSTVCCDALRRKRRVSAANALLRKRRKCVCCRCTSSEEKKGSLLALHFVGREGGSLLPLHFVGREDKTGPYCRCTSSEEKKGSLLPPLHFFGRKEGSLLPIHFVEKET